MREFGDLLKRSSAWDFEVVLTRDAWRKTMHEGGEVGDALPRKAREAKFDPDLEGHVIRLERELFDLSVENQGEPHTHLRTLRIDSKSTDTNGRPQNIRLVSFNPTEIRAIRIV